MKTNPEQIVRFGYDAVGEAYARLHVGDGLGGRPDYLGWVLPLFERLPSNPDILELGSGSGVPVAQALSSRSNYLGVDLSAAQVAMATERVPEATFVAADMSTLEYPNDSFDGIIALYSIIHLPLEKQPDLFRRIGRWLRPGGFFLGTLGLNPWTGTEEDWLGVEGATMYWSHADAETYRIWLREAGLRVVVDQVIPEGKSGHQLLVGVR